MNSNIARHIRASLELPAMVVRMYLEDLCDADLLIRPLSSMNHIAWQMGHLIASENFHIEQVVPGAMPALPEGFRDQHTKETAKSDEAADFLSKQRYVDLMNEQRSGTLAALEELSDETLLSESPAAINYFGPTVGSVFAGEAAHWMMHAGQWAVVRRKLGRPPLF